MTVVLEEFTYGEVPYGTLPYGAGLVYAHSGVQFEAVILELADPEGVQFESEIKDLAVPNGVQFSGEFLNSLNNQGLQFFATNLGFRCPGYGESDYGTLAYGETRCFASGAVQFIAQTLDISSPQGVQIDVIDFPSPIGSQFEGVITVSDSEGVQFNAVTADFGNQGGVQYDAQMVNFLKNEGVQFLSQIVDLPDAEGVEFIATFVNAGGVEFRVNLYNTTQLRVVCDILSRGAKTGAGNNAWGNAIATGQNWQTNSQDPAADFTIQNLNTDTTEQVYRSQIGTITGVNIDLDSETTPGMFTDTLAILNHNLTTGASIVLIASDNSSFTPIGKTINITPRTDNIYHIEPDLPLSAFRYWRFQLDDPNNTDGYLEIGTMIMGEAVIMTTEECMIDRLRKRTVHFTDSVKTEGFTSVKNNRVLKNRISIRFESLRFDKGNFQNLDSIFKTARTSQKCLWIPTPSILDPSITERFAVWGKLPEIPSEEHNIKGTAGSDLDFISFDVDVHEDE